MVSLTLVFGRFVAMERIYQAEVAQRSNDPFWCLLPVDQPLRARRDTYGDAGLSALPSSRLWECLDIAAPSTLGGIDRGALNFHCPTSTDPTSTDCAWTFDALTPQQQGSDRLFGGTETCDAKVVGDGTVNSLDIAVLMYAQFGEGPCMMRLRSNTAIPPVQLAGATRSLCNGYLDRR